MEFDAFLSHQWSTKPLVEATATLLTSNGYSVWLDTQQMLPGASLDASIALGISASKVVIVFLSPAYLNSKNCKKEICLADSYGKPLLVVKLPGVDCPPRVDAGRYAADMAPILAPLLYLGVGEGATCTPEAELLAALVGLGVTPAAAVATSAPPPTFSLRTIPWEDLLDTPVVKGSGSFGTVRVYKWAARGGMEVAVKEMHPAALSVLQPSDVAAFKREAELQARLEHDGVARVYAVAEGRVDGRSRYGLVMKLYEGPLGHVLGREEGGLCAEDRVSLIQQLAGGLAYIHGEGVVHGDLKPDNVLLAKGWKECALTDFGLGQLKLAGSMTSAGGGKGVGTPAFMAPELFEEDEEGERVHGVSKPADVYAFGVTAWCILADKALPYPLKDGSGKVVKVARRVPDGMRPGDGMEERGVGERWMRLLERCWAAEPEQRPRMSEVVQEIGGEGGMILGVFGHQGQGNGGADESLVSEAGETGVSEGGRSAAPVAREMQGGGGAIVAATEPQQTALEHGGRSGGAAIAALLQAAQELTVEPVGFASVAGRLISCSADMSLRLWDTETGTCVRQLIGHKEQVFALCALDGRRIVSGAGDELRVWDAATGACVHVLDGHTGLVRCLCVLEEGSFASGSNDYSVRVWDPATTQCIKVLEGHVGSVTCICAVSIGELRLVSGSTDKTLRAWAYDGACALELRGHSGGVSSICALADGRIVSGSADGVLKVWELSTGTCVRTLAGHSDKMVISLCAMTGTLFVSGAGDHKLRVWDVSTGECLVLEGHSGPVNSVAKLQDGRLASASFDSTVRVWDAAAGECVLVLKGHTGNVTSVALLSEI